MQGQPQWLLRNETHLEPIGGFTAGKAIFDDGEAPHKISGKRRNKDLMNLIEKLENNCSRKPYMINVKLSVLTGPLQGQERVFDEPELFIVGRTDDCHFALPSDHYLSRHHFLLDISPPDVVMKDLGSLNGTFVNEIKYGGRVKKQSPEDARKLQKPVILGDGDILKVGKTEIRVSIEIQAKSPEKPAECPEAGEGAVSAPESKRSDKSLCKGNGETLIQKLIQDNPTYAYGNTAAIMDELLEALNHSQTRKSGQSEEKPRIGDFIITEKLGSGGFGAVYRAIHAETSSEVALKTMLETRAASPKALKMFEREIEINMSLKHPHIILMNEYGRCSGIHYFSLELMDGGSLWDLMEKGTTRVPFDTAAQIMLHSLEGLAYAHNRDIIHRDLKPANILLSKKQEVLIAKVSDFGLAKNFAKAGLTSNKITDSDTLSADSPGFCGSPPYMAPEHILHYRHLKPQTDVFEIAATFYHMLTGQTVWDMRRGDIICEILQSQVKPISSVMPDIPVRVGECLDRALSRDSASRHKNAGEMLEDLKKSL